jgi:hypothetical protein
VKNLGLSFWPTKLAAALSLGTSTVHFLVAPEHFGEWWVYGLFFLAVATFQGLFAMGLIMPHLRICRLRQTYCLASSATC